MRVLVEVGPALSSAASSRAAERPALPSRFPSRRRRPARPIGRPVSGRRERDRRRAAGGERSLLVEAERDGEVEQLVERRRMCERNLRRLAGRGDEERIGRAGVVAREDCSQRRRPADGIEVDDREDRPMAERLPREPLGAEPAVRAAVGREEHEGVQRRALGGSRLGAVARGRARAGRQSRRRCRRGRLLRRRRGARGRRSRRATAPAPRRRGSRAASCRVRRSSHRTDRR